MAALCRTGNIARLNSRCLQNLNLPRLFSDSSKKNKEDQKDKQLKLVLAALDAPRKKEGPISQEEKDRRYKIGRAHNIGRIQEHNNLNHDLTCKMRMKEHALKMLPKGSRMQEEALKDSPPLAPKWLPFPTVTPPIEGFNPSDYPSLTDK